jgi:hypothetical protein
LNARGRDAALHDILTLDFLRKRQGEEVFEEDGPEKRTERSIYIEALLRTRQRHVIPVKKF